MGYGDNLNTGIVYDRNQGAPAANQFDPTRGWTMARGGSVADRNQIATPQPTAPTKNPWDTTGGLTKLTSNIAQGNTYDTYSFKDPLTGATKYYSPYGSSVITGQTGQASGQLAMPNSLRGVKQNGPGGLGWITDKNPWAQGGSLMNSRGGGFGDFSDTMGTIAPLLMAGAPIAGLMAGGAVAGTTAGNIMGPSSASSQAAAAGSDAGMLPATQGAGTAGAGAGEFSMAGAGLGEATPMGVPPVAESSGYTGLGMSGTDMGVGAGTDFASTAGGGLANSSLAQNMITGSTGAGSASGSLGSFLSSLMPTTNAGYAQLGLGLGSLGLRLYQGQQLRDIANESSSRANPLEQPQRAPYQNLLNQYMSGNQDITKQPMVKAELDYAMRQAQALLAKQGLTGAGNAPITAINYANEAMNRSAMPYLSLLSGNAGFNQGPGSSGDLYGRYASGATGDYILGLEDLARMMTQRSAGQSQNNYNWGAA